MLARRHPVLFIGAISVVLVVLLGLAYAALAPLSNGPLRITAPDAAAPTWAKPAAAPATVDEPRGEGITDLIDPEWLASTSELTGIPPRALAAYAGAAVVTSETSPDCGIGWNTLAGIGWVESRHGSYGGSVLAANGNIRPGIYGIALDGSSTAHIPDSDDGRYDKDSEYDRAVGPMQMIPQSWRNWRIDGNGDGKRSPQNIDDAVLAAANYLCRAREDMTDKDGWRDTIATYNSAPSYLLLVAAKATEYAR